MSKSKETTEEVIKPNIIRLFELLLVEYGKVGEKARPKGGLLLEAGFSPTYAKNPHLIFRLPIVQDFIKKMNEKIEDRHEDFIDEIDKRRRMAIKFITEKKLKGASPSVLTYVADTMIKNHQLLTGKDTSKLGFNLDPDEKEEKK